MAALSSFFGWLRGNATAQKRGTQSPMPSAVAYDDVPAIGPDSALQVSTVWACVRLLCDTVSALPLFVYKGDEAGRRDLARGEVIYTVLHDAPNKRQTAAEFWHYMVLNLVLRGNAYARLTRNGAGEVVSMFPMAADQVAVEVLADGALAYVYRIDSTEVVIPEADVLHIRGMGNGIVGMSPLDYMRASVGLAQSAQNHTSGVYRKGARRPGILMTDRVLSAQQRDALRASFGEIATGGSRELYVLEANFKFDPIGMSPADLQLLETRRFAVEDIARWFGVPSVMVNDTAKTTTWGTGVEQLIEGFYKFTIRPMLESIEQAIDRRVLTVGQRARGLSAEFSLDALLRASLKDRMQIYSTAVQNGIFTRNECRQLENLPPVEGGDELTAQTNLLPLEKLGDDMGAPAINDAVEPTSADKARRAIADLEAKAETVRRFDEIRSLIQARPDAVAPEVRVDVAAPIITVNLPEMAPNFKADVLPATYTVNVSPTPVEIRNEIAVAPTPVEVTAQFEATMPPADVRVAVELPPRKTTTNVVRDRDGNIIQATQVETDL